MATSFNTNTGQLYAILCNVYSSLLPILLGSFVLLLNFKNYILWIQTLCHNMYFNFFFQPVACFFLFPFFFLQTNNFFKKIFIGVQLIYNVVLVSGVQQSESVIHIHISTLFKILFPHRSLKSIEQSSLCYIVVYIYSGILLSHTKGQNNAICSNMDGPRDCHTE